MKEEANKPAKKVTRWYSSRLRDEVRNWPKRVREEVGRQLNKVEYGSPPDDFKLLENVIVNLRIKGK